MNVVILVDGSSDRALIPIIRWSLAHIGVVYPVSAEVVSNNQIHRINPNAKTLEERIPIALDLFPCDLFIVHRDTEAQDPSHRRQEIDEAINSVLDTLDLPRTVPIIPIRMHEAWLLFDEAAIRRASGNPNGKDKVKLPSIHSVERLPDPKQTLDDLLSACCGLKGARLKRFHYDGARSRVVDYIDDFSPLLHVSAFADFIKRLSEVMRYSHWL